MTIKIPRNPKVLTPQEIEKLLKVRTSPKEALQMKRRFTETLKMVEDPRYNCIEQGALDCPHCQTAHKKNKEKHFNCSQCAYKKAVTFEEHYGNTSCFCVCFFSFGDVHYREVRNNIGLNREWVCIEDAKGMSPSQKKKVRTFCLGHIQWANIILQKKTRKTKKGKSSAKRK